MSIWDEALAENNVWLVGVSGRLDQTQTPQLEAMLQKLLDEGHNRVIVDLSEVSYINSGGLRCLVTAWRHARQDGGNVHLCCLSPRVGEVFSMVGFDKVFQIFPGRDEAVRAWQSPD